MRALRVLVNWLIILSSPIWVLPVFFTVAFQIITRDGVSDQLLHDIMTGKEWFV